MIVVKTDMVNLKPAKSYMIITGFPAVHETRIPRNFPDEFFKIPG